MREIKLNTKDMKKKTLFKVTFESGKTYYSLTNISTIKSFINSNTSLAKLHLENPSIHPITTFESLMLDESYEIQILGSGPIEEMAVIKDKLVETDSMSINYKKTVTEKKKLVKEILKVPMKYSKVLKSSTGDVVNYISSSYARMNDLVKHLNETKRYPLDNTFVQINLSIERI